MITHTLHGSHIRYNVNLNKFDEANTIVTEWLDKCIERDEKHITHKDAYCNGLLKAMLIKIVCDNGRTSPVDLINQ